MSSNKLIVESDNDKHFLQAIIRHLNSNIEVASPIMILDDDDYKSMNGLDHKKLKDALNYLKGDIQKGKIERVGIDIDNEEESNRIDLVNQSIQEVFPGSSSLTEVKKFINITFDGFDFQLACYFTNVDGKGELETVLKEIKNQNSDYADCLNNWKDCVESRGNEEIKTKDFDKLWVRIYIRYDTPSKKQKQKAATRCTFKYVMRERTDIWDFEHPTLNDLKEFLQMFC